MPTALSILRDTFGFPSFKGLQAEAIQHVASGGDALILMPTGSGKSLCYQIPALLRPGTAVVISPLIALMEDQVTRLTRHGIRSACLNSYLDADQVWRIERDLQEGGLQLLYVTPERLANERFLGLMEKISIGLFAVDEAHCVSQWGHDFRTDYLKLSALAERFPSVPRVALTATADLRTRQEIILGLRLQNARLFQQSFDRPNLTYRIIQKHQPLRQLDTFLRSRANGQSGLIYCLTRRQVEETAQALERLGYRALPYHAGLDPEIRNRHQQAFLEEDGILMVATVAFGMGIDHPRVRFVVHFDLPRSIEAYYQETGRAGRDGEAAEALLLFSARDGKRLQHLIDQGDLAPRQKRAEHARLERLMGLCETPLCRRTVLLNHFAEPHPGSCGNCDNCLTPQAVFDGREAAQKALSCLHRTRGLMGIQHQIDVLLGRAHLSVEQHGHQHLSTFGIGESLDERGWRTVFRQLLVLGLVATSGEDQDRLVLTERARPMLKGDQPFYLPLALQKPEQQLAPPDADLLSDLRELRRTLAEEEKLPAYRIFNDGVLRDLARQGPTSLEALTQVRGIGPQKQQRYGTRLVERISRWKSGTSLTYSAASK